MATAGSTRVIARLWSHPRCIHEDRRKSIELESPDGWVHPNNAELSYSGRLDLDGRRC